MPLKCLVPGCKSNRDPNKRPYFSTFSFPKAEEMKERWLEAIGRTGAKLSKWSRICELHFHESDVETEVKFRDPNTGEMASSKLYLVRLKEDAVPSLFEGSPDFCPNRRFNIESYEEKKLRLQSDKLQSALMKCIKKSGINVKDADAVSKIAILVPINIPASSHSKLLSETSALKEWKNNDAAALISLYESEKCLYDQDHLYFHDERETNKAYSRIQTSLAKKHINSSIPDIKAKLNSLIRQYVSEKVTKDTAVLAGHVTEQTYEPRLWCYSLLQFLDKYIMDTKLDKLGNSVEEVILPDDLPKFLAA